MGNLIDDLNFLKWRMKHFVELLGHEVFSKYQIRVNNFEILEKSSRWIKLVCSTNDNNVTAKCSINKLVIGITQFFFEKNFLRITFCRMSVSYDHMITQCFWNIFESRSFWELFLSYDHPIFFKYFLNIFLRIISFRASWCHLSGWLA